MRCANCQAEGHVAKDCPKPRLEISRRLCYECGKPGHVAKDCRSRGNRSGTAPVRMVDEEENYFGCIECDGWQVTARKPKTAARPTPTSAILGDFIPSLARWRRTMSSP